MDYQILEQLHSKGLISTASFARIEKDRHQALFSIYWEVKTLLYLGIVLLTAGLGILIYKNIDSIGHGVILTFLLMICIGCLFYCFRNKQPFAIAKVPTPNLFFDYILLLGALSFLIFLGYLQYQYSVFGIHYGMATFIPMLVLFYLAYNFDHTGILNMAIINLGLWMGVSITPKHLLNAHTFDSQSAIYTYLAFGLLLLSIAWITTQKHIKTHFRFSYQHYGLHGSLIAMSAGYFFYYDYSWAVIWLAGMVLLCTAAYQYSYRHKEFYFLLLTILYGYFAVSCFVCRLLLAIKSTDSIPILFMYFIVSAIGLVVFIIDSHKKLKAV